MTVMNFIVGSPKGQNTDRNNKKCHVWRVSEIHTFWESCFSSYVH